MIKTKPDFSTNQNELCIEDKRTSIFQLGRAGNARGFLVSEA